jgi:hypothetical protein
MADATSLYISSDGNIIKSPCNSKIMGCASDGVNYPTKCPGCCSFCSDNGQCTPHTFTAVLSGLTWRTGCIQICRDEVNYFTKIVTQHGNTVVLTKNPLNGCIWSNTTDLTVTYDKYPTAPCTGTPVRHTSPVECSLARTDGGAPMWVFQMKFFPTYGGLVPYTFDGFVSTTTGVCSAPSTMTNGCVNSPNRGPAYGGTATFS